jgi:hypothetical protein
MKKPRIRTVVIALLVGGAAALALPYFLVGGAIAYEAGGEYLARTSFDSSAWQDSARVFSQDPVRIRMVDDLLKRHSLDEMTRAEVVALLGEPDDTPYFREWDMVYWLGPERGLIGIDSEWLVLRLDEHQQVIEHRVVTD